MTNQTETTKPEAPTEAGGQVERVVGRLTALDEACYGNEDAENELAELRAAVVAMAEDGWLYHGPEGMTEAQEKCYRAYRRMTPNAPLEPPR